MMEWSSHGDVDRLSPRLRPDEPVVGYQEWEDLLFVHWRVDPHLLQGHIPSWLTLDTFQGEAYVTLIPFRVTHARPVTVPRLVGMDFLETNLRTYVRADGLPGIYFFSLEASSPLAVVGARLLTGLPYFLARMRMKPHANGVVDYALRRRPRGPRSMFTYRVGKPLGPAEPHSRDFFLLERYVLFVERGPLALRGPVHHAPLDVHEVQLLSLSDELAASAGLTRPALPNVLVHYVPHISVEFFPFRRVEARVPAAARMVPLQT